MSNQLTVTASEPKTIAITRVTSEVHPKAKIVRITTVPESLKVLLRDQLRYMSQHFEIVAVSSPGKILDEVGEREGIRTKAIAMTRSVTPISDLVSLWKLYRFLKKERADVVHTHTPKAGLLGMIAGAMAGVPVKIHTVAGLPLVESRGIKKWILKNIERITSFFAQHVYPNSHALAAYMAEEKLCPSKKLKVVGYGSSNGINVNYFTLNDKIREKAEEIKLSYSIRKENFVYLYVGRLVKDKGINELVSAFKRVNRVFPQTRLLLVGAFEQELDPLGPDTIQDINNHPGIIRATFQEDVRPFIAAAHTMVFPTYREGFPNVPMQAGCMELPCIVTNINGCNEIITDGLNGLVIPVKDEAALEKAMITMATDEDLLYSMKQRCREMIVDRFDHRMVWQLILEEYRNLLQHKHVYAIF